MKLRDGDQALPTINESPFVQDDLIAYIERRKQVGIERYGTALQPHNGRDALRDAFEEAVDLAVYLAQVIIERDGQLPGGSPTCLCTFGESRTGEPTALIQKDCRIHNGGRS